MIGTTRSWVSFFMNLFRKLGFIDYDGGSGLQVQLTCQRRSPRLRTSFRRNVVSEALLTIAGSVRNTATVLALLAATRSPKPI